MTARPKWVAELLDFQLRSASPADHERVRRFLTEMDREGLYQRHFAHGEAPNLGLLGRLNELDNRDRVAVLAFGHGGEVVGHGEYVAKHGEAEFALMVSPTYRARGIGRRLLLALIDIAATSGQCRLYGMIQATNARALKLALSAGLRTMASDDPTVVIVSRPLTASLDARPDSRPVAGYPLPIFHHDPDRTPIHRSPGPGASLWPSGG